MKSRKLILPLFGTALLGMILSACGGSAPKVPSEHVPPADTKDLNVATRVIDFASDKGAFDFYASSGYSNGEPFNVTWNAGNVKKEDNNLHLQISPALGAETPYFGGEMRSYKFYGYGDYGVRMKPAKVAGTASTFFTYTGEWDSEAKHPSTGETDTRNPDNAEGVHDEIDIEFLGKDTTKVQFNYFTNGRGGNEFMYDLGFDASEEWHDYGFRWERDRITWFVDEKPVYTATTNIPSHPGRIISNYWCGTEAAAAWMDVYDGKTSGDAVYSWFSATAEGKETHKDPEPVDPGTEIDWDQYDAVAFTGVAGNTETYSYELSANDTAMEITYTDVPQNYNNLNVAVPSAAADARALAFEVENKGTAAVAVRGNANATTTHGEHDIYAVNVSAKQDGVPVNTDMEWGGSFFVIEPGQTSLCEIVYSEAISRLEWMIDSHVAGTQSGDIVIKNLKFDLEGEITPDTPAEKPTATKPANVQNENAVVLSDIAGNVGDDSTYSYLLSDDSKAMAVTYVVTGGPNYNNINVAAPSSSEESRKLSFKVENKGEETVAVRCNANNNIEHGPNKIPSVNVSATQDGVAVTTDTSWGGSFFSVDAGKTVSCEIVYSEAITRVEWMIDSHINGDHVGYIVISELEFGEAQPGPEPAEQDLITLGFEAKEGTYAVESANGSTTVSHNVALSGWENTSAVISSYIDGTVNNLQFKVTNNNSEREAVIEFGLIDDTWSTQYLVNNGDADEYNLDGRGKYTIAASAEKVVNLAFDATSGVTRLWMFYDSFADATLTSGSITFSDVIFSKVGEESETVVITLGFEAKEGTYAVESANGSTTVSHNVALSGWENTSAVISSYIDGSVNRLQFKVTNNNTEREAVIEFGLIDETWSTSLLVNNNDSDYFNDDGRGKYTIAAGAERVVNLAFDATSGVTRLWMFYDSFADATLTSGSITFSEVTFSTVQAA